MNLDTSQYRLSTSILQIFPLFQKIKKLRTAAEGVRVFEVVNVYVKFYITYSSIEIYIFFHYLKKVKFSVKFYVTICVLESYIHSHYFEGTWKT